MRQAHRWLSVLFTLFVLANFAVMPLGDEALGMAVGGVTLLPLLLLMITGLYLFVLPWRRGDAASDEAR
jgi:hypothetical protein